MKTNSEKEELERFKATKYRDMAIDLMERYASTG